MNVNLLKEVVPAEKAESSRSAETEQETHNSNPRQRSNRLSRQNRAVKKIMARELARLGLPDSAVERILHFQSMPSRSNRSQQSR